MTPTRNYKIIYFRFPIKIISKPTGRGRSMLQKEIILYWLQPSRYKNHPTYRIVEVHQRK